MKDFSGLLLPAGWRWETIRPHIADFQPGIARGEKSRATGYVHLRMNNISSELRLTLDEVWRIPASDNEVHECALIDGDVLFNNTNSRNLVGKTCLFRKPADEVFLFSNHITRIRTAPSLASAFLVAWLNYLWLHGFFRDRCDVWVNQAAIRVEDVLFPTKMPLPPQREDQDRLAGVLAAKLEKIEGMRRATERAEKVVGGMELALLRDCFEAPAGGSWKHTTLGDLAEVVMGQSPDGATYNETGQGLPLLNGPTEFGDDHPTPVQWTTAPRKICKPEDLLLCVRGNTTGRMNRADQAYALGRGVAALRGRENKGHTRFVRHAIRYQLGKLLVGSERSTFPNVGKDEIEAFSFSAPSSVAEQEEFADGLDRKLERVEAVSAAASSQLEAVSSLPAATLREFFELR